MKPKALSPIRNNSHTKSNSMVKKAGLHKTKHGKCHRPNRNPYLNFLHEFRQRCGDLSAVEIICRGAKEWKNMPKEEKLRYLEEAFYAPKKRKPAQHVQKVRFNMQKQPEDCGIVCPSRKSGGACGMKQKRKRRSGVKRRQKRGCGMKRRRQQKRRSCGKRRKRMRCPI